MALNQGILFNKEKFKQILHHLISRVGTLDNVGKTVLFKMLYFSDFDYYELYNESITGERYFKLPHGPAPFHFNIGIKELKKERKIKEIKSTYGYPQIKFISLCTPETKLLNGKEIQIIEKIINRLSGMYANQVSSYSHDDMPWKATEKGKEIDYELVFYRDSIFSVTENAQFC